MVNWCQSQIWAMGAFKSFNQWKHTNPLSFAWNLTSSSARVQCNFIIQYVILHNILIPVLFWKKLEIFWFMNIRLLANVRLIFNLLLIINLMYKVAIKKNKFHCIKSRSLPLKCYWFDPHKRFTWLCLYFMSNTLSFDCWICMAKLSQ